MNKNLEKFIENIANTENQEWLDDAIENLLKNKIDDVESDEIYEEYRNFIDESIELFKKILTLN